MGHFANRFDEKVVMITGGGNGIGAACARRFLVEGASVDVIDLNAGGLADSFTDVSSDRLFTMVGDCTDAQVLEAFHMEATQVQGPVDVLFNNVGRSARERAGPFHLSEEEVWRLVLETSLMTTMRLGL